MTAPIFLFKDNMAQSVMIAHFSCRDISQLVLLPLFHCCSVCTELFQKKQIK